MGKAAIVRLSKRGALTLPLDMRRDLPAGAEFIIRRQDRNIVLLQLEERAPMAYDLSPEAGSFVNELVSEGYSDYVVQSALTNAEHELIDP